MTSKTKTPKTKTTVNASVRAFERLARDYWMQTFERFPVHGGSAGIRRLNSELGRATPEVHREQIELARATLDSLIALPVHDFEGDAWLGRLTLRSHLITELMRLEELQLWRTNPQNYLDNVADGIHAILVRHGDNLKPVAAALVSRMRQIPKYLDEAVGCIRHPVPLWTRLAMNSATGICSLLASLPAQLAGKTSNDDQQITAWADEACAAVGRYASRIGRIKPGPAGGFSVGRERFERLIRERLGLNWTAQEAQNAALGLIEKLKAEQRQEAKKFHPRKSATEILEEASHQWQFEGRDLLEAYQKQMVIMRERFLAADAMTFPKGDRLLVKPVPDFMVNQFPTAAYSSPGALDPDQTGIFWVNDLSLRRKSEKEKRAEIDQHFGLELTSAHEAYPGHHLQFVMQHRHDDLPRKLADHAIYYEGWTLWCEQMTVDLKVSDNPYLKLQQLHDALWRANRIIIDCGLQTGTLSYDGACKRLQNEVGFTRGRAQGDVNWYTSSPTVPMSYLLGKMELLRLKRTRMDQQGWTLRQFNDWVLSFGAIPWSWIEASGL